MSAWPLKRNTSIHACIHLHKNIAEAYQYLHVFKSFTTFNLHYQLTSDHDS